jgi:hypothetical protein
MKFDEILKRKKILPLSTGEGRVWVGINVRDKFSDFNA